MLLEEPELSLHNEVIRQLPRLITQATTRSNRQVIVSTHASEILNDPGVDPAEVLLLVPTEHETKVVPGSADASLREAAVAQLPLGDAVSALTRPKGIERLAYLVS